MGYAIGYAQYKRIKGIVLVTKHRHITRWIASTTLAFLVAGCATQQGTGSDNAKIIPVTLEERPVLDSSAPRSTNTAPVVQKITPTQPRHKKIKLQANAPDTYIVRKGDTLWDISKKFLQNPWYWPEIWHANPGIKNPHLIYPGDRISLYYVNGEPRLGINREGGNMDGKLSPHIRARNLDDKDTGIPIQTISPFLIHPEIIPEEQLKEAAHVLDSQEERLIYGEGDKIYVRGLKDTSLGARYSVFRPGSTFLDPKTGELLGFEAVHSSDAEVIRGGEPTTVELINTSREVLRGDRLLPAKANPDDYFFVPHAPEADARGEIISVFDAINQIAGYQIAVLNLGKREGVEEGHVFSVNQMGRTVNDYFHGKDQSKKITLPEERSGLVMVFQTFDKISYALVMEAERPIRVGDSVTAP